MTGTTPGDEGTMREEEGEASAAGPRRNDTFRPACGSHAAPHVHRGWVDGSGNGVPATRDARTHDRGAAFAGPEGEGAEPSQTGA